MFAAKRSSGLTACELQPPDLRSQEPCRQDSCSLAPGSNSAPGSASTPGADTRRFSPDAIRGYSTGSTWRKLETPRSRAASRSRDRSLATRHIRPGARECRPERQSLSAQRLRRDILRQLGKGILLECWEHSGNVLCFRAIERDHYDRNYLHGRRRSADVQDPVGKRLHRTRDRGKNDGRRRLSRCAYEQLVE